MRHALLKGVSMVNDKEGRTCLICFSYFDFPVCSADLNCWMVVMSAIILNMK